MTDSTIAPPPNQRFSLKSNFLSWLLDTRKDAIDKKKVSIHFLVCRDLSIDDVKVSRDTVFQEMRPVELVLKPAISLKKSWRGYRGTTRMWPCNVTTIEHEREKCESPVFRKERLVYPRSITLLRLSYFVWYRLKGDHAEGMYEIPYV